MKKLSKLQAFIFICLFVSGSQAYAEMSTHPDDLEIYKTSPYEKWIWNGFLGHVGEYDRFISKNLGYVNNYLTATFGNPISTTKTTKQHWSSPRLYYDYISRNYEGLTILTRKNSKMKNPASEDILKITLENPKYKLMHGLRIGDPVKKYLSALGDKRPIIGRKINYHARTGEVNSINATMFLDKKSRVTKIIWDYTNHYND